MGDFYAGLVLECLSDAELLIVKRLGGEEIVKDRISHEPDGNTVNPGDVIKIEKRPAGEDRAIDVTSQTGFSTGNLVGIVEEVFEDVALVRTQHGLSTVTRVPDDVTVGETIELTGAMTYRNTLADDPVEIDDLQSNIDDDPDTAEYEWRYNDEITVTLDDLGGLEDVKQTLQEKIIQPLHADNADLREELGITLSQGVLFHGEAGTGKTRTAKALTNHVDGELFIVGGPELVSKYYGETERQIRDVFREAQHAADAEDSVSIIFFDELDSMTPPRDQADETERRIVAQLLSEMDGFDERGDIIVIGATNLVDEIDSAVLRPGRFDEKLEFTKPGIEGRESILEILLDETPTTDDIDLIVIAQQTEHFTGAELAAVVEQAKYLALRDGARTVRMEHLLISAGRQREAQS